MLDPIFTNEDLLYYIESYQGKTKKGTKYKKKCNKPGCCNYIEVMDKSKGWSNGNKIIVWCDEHGR